MRARRSFCGIMIFGGVLSSLLPAAEGQMPAPEDFQAFFRRFRSDRDFQVSRIRFPLAVLVWEPGADEPERKEQGRERWEFERFQSGDGLRWTAPRAGASADEYSLGLEGEDNGISLSYEFRRLKGRWFLVQIVDSSA
ncbi:MAG: hypothetical protein KJ067_04075 [Vicinamibacteria bacterium]|nr:hypothetical protein [Vicinamibacteria bacterium]